jgi:hypothetical protein
MSLSNTCNEQERAPACTSVFLCNHTCIDAPCADTTKIGHMQINSRLDVAGLSLTGQDNDRRLERPRSTLVIDSVHGASASLGCCFSVRSATSKDVRLLGACSSTNMPLQAVFLAATCSPCSSHLATQQKRSVLCVMSAADKFTKCRSVMVPIESGLHLREVRVQLAEW